jgi:hypothetical protein
MSTGKAWYRDEVSLGYFSLRKAIMSGLAPAERAKRKQPETEAVDPHSLLADFYGEVSDFEQSFSAVNARQRSCHR